MLMSASDRIVDELQDNVSMQHALLEIMQAIETGWVPDILPTFHDEWTEDLVETIFDALKKKKKT